MITPSHTLQRMATQPCNSPLPSAQSGVVLIIALILLVVISLLAVTSLRGAGSSENISGNVRTTELATQAAEIALNYCEAAAVELTSSAGPYTTTFPAANILPASSTLRGLSTATWDAASTSSTVTWALNLNQVNQTGMAMTTYKRPPECMVEIAPTMPTGTSTVSNSTSFVITARGFGPEVPALTGSLRIRPVGSVVFLQSTVGK